MNKDSTALIIKDYYYVQILLSFKQKKQHNYLSFSDMMELWVWDENVC